MKSTAPKTTRLAVAPSVRAARLAITTIFFLIGVTFASWAARIPDIQEQLRLDNGTLGSVLLGLTLGAMVAMPFAGWLIARFGSKPVTTVAAVIQCLTLPLIALSVDAWTLLAALSITGMSNGTLNVAINDQAVAVEKQYGRPIMSTFHALFSLGGMAGAAIGACMAKLRVEPLNHFTIIGTVVGLLTVFTLRFLVNTSPVAPTGQSFTVKTNRTLLNLAVIAFCVLLGEGAMADWSAVYLNQNTPDDPGLAPLGYAAFSLAMAVGRLNGDWLIARLSPARMLRISGLLAAAGLAFALSFNFPVTVLLGFACVGFGFSTVVPIVFSAAGRTPRMPSSTALATVTTLGYLGFLAGPPIIGWGAGLLSLRGSLAVVILLSLMIALLAPSVDRKEAE